jgi:hypothetical protein
MSHSEADRKAIKAQQRSDALRQNLLRRKDQKTNRKDDEKSEKSDETKS